MSGAWWRVPGGAVAAAITVALAATGCAAKEQGNAGPMASSQSPAKTVATSAPAPAAAQAASTGDPAGILIPAPSPPAPRCPALVHYAAGNAGPLFCTDGTDDPATLRYFTGLHLKVMSLPAGASQAQAVAAICADLRHTSGGAEYSAYLLAANREHWFFIGIAKVHGTLSDLCHPASPSPSPS
jgi:hypothetical protein